MWDRLLQHDRNRLADWKVTTSITKRWTGGNISMNGGKTNIDRGVNTVNGDRINVNRGLNTTNGGRITTNWDGNTVNGSEGYLLTEKIHMWIEEKY